MKKKILLFGLLVLFLAPIIGVAQIENPTYREPAIGDSWTYDWSSNILLEEILSVGDLEGVRFTTPYGDLDIILDVNYTTYWEVGYVPDEVPVFVTFEVDDLGFTTVEYVKVNSINTSIWNTTMFYSNLSSIETPPLGVNMTEYEEFTLSYNNIDWVGVDWLEIPENSGFINVTIQFTVYNGTTSEDYTLNQGFEISIYPNGYKELTGYHNIEIVDLVDDIYNISYVKYLETQVGIEFINEFGYLDDAYDHIGYIVWPMMLPDRYERTNITIGDHIYPVDRDVDNRNSYGVKCGILVELFSPTFIAGIPFNGRTYLYFASANFECAYIDVIPTTTTTTTTTTITTIITEGLDMNLVMLIAGGASAVILVGVIIIFRRK